MFLFLLRRTLWVVLLLVGVNFLAFSYAHYGRFEQLKRNPIFAQEGRADSVLPFYIEYLDGFIKGSPMPMMTGVNILDVVSTAAKNSLGLLGIAFGISMLVGLVTGVYAAKVNPPRVARWLIPISAVSLAMPGLASLAITSAAKFGYGSATRKPLA